MVNPERSLVRPRVVNGPGGDSLPLDDEVLPLVAAGEKGLIVLLGPSGSGKTTALRHLAALLPLGAPVVLLDEPELATLYDIDTERRLVLYSAREPTPHFDHRATYTLARWNNDDRLEYLCARHRTVAAGVAARLRADDDIMLCGMPELWRPVLDHLAADPGLPNAAAAVRRHLAELITSSELQERVHRVCLESTVEGCVVHASSFAAQAPGLAPLLRHPSVVLFLAAQAMSDELRAMTACETLHRHLPRALILAIAEQARDERCRAQLLRLLEVRIAQPMVVSILHVMGWRPKGPLSLLDGAYLSRANWAGIQLSELHATDADFNAANLSGANLHKANFRNAAMVRANLSGANLSLATVSNARLIRADLRGANLTAAHFVHANLTSANFGEADLTDAELLNADITDANFDCANLSGAKLGGLKLSVASFLGASFKGADMPGVDMEGMDLPEVCLAMTDLRKALLTGSRLVGADLSGADLREAGLAEVDWENACLRDVDLTGASFHLGSTRGGLVGSTLASEGTRTGFYTDDYHDNTFKTPEEVRKANLCGVDLRGAAVTGTDFYLVDLRGAQYEPEQEKHFRRCGAILDDWTGECARET